ncbi:hypothetical protein [Vreelandella populi]|nr:hypothetical protein [Halomonas populi]
MAEIKKGAEPGLTNKQMERFLIAFDQSRKKLAIKKSTLKTVNKVFS